MRKLAIVIALIKQGDSYLLQNRNGDPKIGGANLLGCFGGKIDPGENQRIAIKRELKEETSLRPKANDFEELGTVKVLSDHQLEEVEVTALVFSITIPEDVEVKATEGELVRLTEKEAKMRLKDLTTGTRAAFEQFIF